MKKAAKAILPCMQAIDGSCGPCIRALLANGADASIKNDEGQTALDLANVHKKWGVTTIP